MDAVNSGKFSNDEYLQQKALNMLESAKSYLLWMVDDTDYDARIACREAMCKVADYAYDWLNHDISIAYGEKWKVASQVVRQYRYKAQNRVRELAYSL